MDENDLTKLRIQCIRVKNITERITIGTKIVVMDDFW